eukprot:scaffold146_cov265-Pinguiococcus_pyrenoidosus.AAC.35
MQVKLHCLVVLRRERVKPLAHEVLVAAFGRVRDEVVQKLDGIGAVALQLSGVVLRRRSAPGQKPWKALLAQQQHVHVVIVHIWQVLLDKLPELVHGFDLGVVAASVLHQSAQQLFDAPRRLVHRALICLAPKLCEAPVTTPGSEQIES